MARHIVVSSLLGTLSDFCAHMRLISNQSNLGAHGESRSLLGCQGKCAHRMGWGVRLSLGAGVLPLGNVIFSVPASIFGMGLEV